MIIGKVATDRSRQSLQDYLHPAGAQAALRAHPAGQRVVVLVEGVYNGENHKRLPLARPGDIIYVAGGGYYQSLIDDGFVAYEPAESPDAPAAEPPVDEDDETDETPPPDAPDPDEPWLIFLDANVGATIAHAVWLSGLHNQEDVRAKYEAEGLNGILAIHGVGSVSARRLLNWAGVPI